MPSKIIGRVACPECDFDAAHVKESEKCIYRFCPECGSQTIAKTDPQKANMTRRMRAVEPDATAPGTAPASGSATSASAPAPTPTGSAIPATPKLKRIAAAPAPTAPRRRGLFG